MNYKSKRWQTLRNKALRRAGYLCEECKRFGKTTYEGLHVHHINPVKDHPNLAYYLDNLYVCCQEHHNSFEDRVTGDLSKEGAALKERMNRRRGIEL